VKICVFGAGAVGGFFAAKLAHAGNDVSVVVRKRTADIINGAGLIAREKAGEINARVKASEDPTTLGIQDAVILTAKAQSLAASVDAIAPLVDRKTLIVFSQNGIACWYPHGLAKNLRAPPKLAHFDVMDRFAANYGDDQFVGGIVRSSNAVVSPGVVQNESATGRNAFLFARTDDGVDERVERLRAAFETAGIDSPVPTPGIRTEMWRKIIMTLSTGPLSVVTGNHTATMKADPELIRVLEAMLAEGHKLTAAYGFPFSADEVKIPGNHHKPSLLQDFERGSQMEWGEVILAAQRFAEAAQLQLPTVDAVVNIATHMIVARGLLPSPEDWKRPA
jgi:2-dehydropantoate 2-reductase